MAWFKLRPTFRIPLNETRDSAIKKLNDYHAQVESSAEFLMFGEYGELHLPTIEHRLWSPHLSFYVFEKDEECYIFGRFAPRVDVWTTVWIAYLALIFLAFFGAMLAISQFMLGSYVWGIWVMVGAFVALAAVYAVAHIGQQWSADQMQKLRDCFEEIVLRANIK
ncbi:MAG TPA: hypothetical protein PKD64_09690 [Pirellulaceae bacterium]|nr:hypothetical protein [Pirellulaceae bacterium]HMO92458.1 hypothetical protein [Pirellulaceae bacterium]HMP67872.1 hypothetical protein [Pirellulaceae bacterium]